MVILDGRAAYEAGWFEAAGPDEASAPGLVAVGDDIAVDVTDGHHLRGHGTLRVDERLQATLAGEVERQDKLVTVQALGGQRRVLPARPCFSCSCRSSRMQIPGRHGRRGCRKSDGGTRGGCARPPAPTLTRRLLLQQVAGKRWKIDIDAPQAAVLMLSAVTLPGNEQARRPPPRPPVRAHPLCSAGATRWTS